MMKRHFDHPNSIRVVLILCVLAAAVSSCAESGNSKDHKASDQPDSTEKSLPAAPLQLGDAAKTEVAFTWREIESGDGVVAIWNGSGGKQDVTAEVTDFALSPGSV